MSDPVRIVVSDKGQPVFSGELTLPVELGRQGENEVEPFQFIKTGAIGRLVMAYALTEREVSRRHAKVEAAGEQTFKLTNISSQLPIGLSTLR